MANRNTASFLQRTAATTHTPDPHNPKASPGSDSPSEAGIKSSRATERGPDVLGGSVQKPVSGKGDHAGASEEGGDPAKKGDRDTPAEQKRASIEAEGQKPLDPADK